MSIEKGGFVYIMANRRRTTLYIGVTCDLARRYKEHRNRINVDAFAAKFNCVHLVSFEAWPDIESAIAREKALKGGNRERKERLINTMNPAWGDLGPGVLAGYWPDEIMSERNC